jgi:hypothetical protein
VSITPSITPSTSTVATCTFIASGTSGGNPGDPSDCGAQYPNAVGDTYSKGSGCETGTYVTGCIIYTSSNCRAATALTLYTHITDAGNYYEMNTFTGAITATFTGGCTT